MAVVLSVVPSLEMVRDFDGFIFRAGERHHGVTDLHRVISALGRIIFRHERLPLRFLFAMCQINCSRWQNTCASVLNATKSDRSIVLECKERDCTNSMM